MRWLVLKVRTANCCRQKEFAQGDGALTVQELLRMRGFGWTSLRDLLSALETFLTDRMQAMEDVQAAVTSADRVEALPKSAQRWGEIAPTLSTLLATAADLRGPQTLLEALCSELVVLADRMEVKAALQEVEVRDLAAGTPSLPVLIIRRLGRTVEALDERNRLILEGRLLGEKRDTLEALGERLGVTRERVRQLEAKIHRKLRVALGAEMGVVASTIHDQLDPILSENDMRRVLDDISPDEDQITTRLFQSALLDAMRYSLEAGVFVDERGRQFLSEFQNGVGELADDVGLIVEAALMQHVPEDYRERFWDWLLRHNRLHRIRGLLARRDTAKARAKAALISIGRPATKAEIAAASGIADPLRVGATLSSVPSVVRADKERWGLKEWIDDEYDGIVGEIIQRIDEDGGVTTTKRLLAEIPAKFGVQATSVEAYMKTARFSVRDGMISLASASSVQLRPLDDVVHGHDDEGAPYWSFVVDGRYFEGHSVTGVPGEIAKALGCEPDSGVAVSLESPIGCREMSLRWKLASPTGATLGYVSGPLRRLGLQPGDRARVTILGPGSAKLSSGDASTEANQVGDADALLQRMLRRRRPS